MPGRRHTPRQPAELSVLGVWRKEDNCAVETLKVPAFLNVHTEAALTSVCLLIETDLH